MAEIYGAQAVCLQVRKSNTAAQHLYTNKLGFITKRSDAKYYIDGEHASHMEKDLKSLRLPLIKGAQVTLSAEEKRANADAREGAGEECLDEGDEVGSLASAKHTAGGFVEIVEKVESLGV